jgi:hypothetical protein
MQISGGPKKYGNIVDRAELLENFEMSCIPAEMLSESPPSYDEFLDLRRKMMALRIKKWFDWL